MNFSTLFVHSPDCATRSRSRSAGRHALRHFVEAFRHTDVLGLSKGGFLIGTYGMKEGLVPFARAFRALPTVRMADVDGDEYVKVRACDFDGRHYFYAVNTDGKSRTFTLDVPVESADLVTGERLKAGRATLQLAPYELRSLASAPDR